MTYRDHFPSCPRCRTTLEAAGRALGCRGCGGRWIEEGLVTEMVHEMHDGLETSHLRFEPRPAGPGEPIGCPTCERPMATLTLERLPIDRCESHGLWFDATELERALHAATGRDPRAESSGAPKLPRRGGSSGAGGGAVVEVVALVLGGLFDLISSAS